MKYWLTAFATVLLLLASPVVFAQKQKGERKHQVGIYGGFGPNYYFNNLVLAKNSVNELNYSFVARVMWEPEYLLSVGFETGYNRLYSIKTTSSTAAGDIHIVNVAIPIQLVISMKFLKDYYANFTMGQSKLLNNVSTSAGNFDASTISLGDFGAAIGYRKAIKPRTFLGAEIKGYYSSKLDDKNVSLVFMVGYKL